MRKYGQSTTFSAQNGQTAELANILVEAAKAMSDTDGCQLYVVSKDSDVQNHVQVFEVWNTKDDHENALENLTTNELIAQARPLLDGQPETIELDVIGGLEGMEAK
jgi:quinol monooxygenase YgiN